jgi:hypothetical protein
MAKKQKPTKHYVEYTRQELRRLQHWFAGFQAAGGKLPPCMSAGGLPLTDPIQKAIRLIDEHIEVSDD